MLKIKIFQSNETEKDVNQFLKDTNGYLVKMWVNETPVMRSNGETTFVTQTPRTSIAILYQTPEMGGMKILRGE